MKLPFVSRERFDDERARCEKLEAELAELRKLLIPGLAPQVKPLIPKMDVNTDLSTVQPIPGRATIAMVTSAANRAAFTRSQTPGAKPLSQEVAENDERHWRQA